MMETKFYPAAAFAFLLLLLLFTSLTVQTLGYAVDYPLTSVSLYIAFPLCAVFTYGYCFPLTKKLGVTAAIMGGLLAGVGMVSRSMYDFTADGLGYQQASVEAVMNGWNPFGPDAVMLWQQLYPSGLWSMEAALAYLHGSIEAAKMFHVWLLVIAVPLLLYGLSRYKANFSWLLAFLAALGVLSTTVLAQLLTHYVDSDAYLAGIAFTGGLLLYGQSRRFNVIAGTVMVAALCIVINTKLSGLYHGVMLCTAAILFTGVRAKRLPWKLGLLLFTGGVFAVLAIGYRPYVTNFVRYGPSLFPPDKVAYGPQPRPETHYFLSSSNTEAFSHAQRPSSFDDIPPPLRFLYSVFSADGGGPHVPARLKWPWQIVRTEWRFSGDPDPRTGGYGPLFALGLLSSCLMFGYAALRKITLDRGLILLAGVFLMFSAMFPQSWWARYVPFGYFVPFALLLSIGRYDRFIRFGAVIIAIIFAVNSEMSAASSYAQYAKSERRFAQVVNELKGRKNVYLVPPVFNYKRYNGAYLPLQRRLKDNGIDSAVVIGRKCPHMAEMYSEFAICY